MTNYIMQNKANKLSTGAALIDIEKAFDSMWHEGVIFKMYGLSPTLYSIFTSDISVPINCKVALYADDTAIIVIAMIYKDHVELPIKTKLNEPKRIYFSVIRPIMLYACPIWKSAI